ncbi:SOS response-associated peptidase family protein [Enorma burkinafasonensis]|uniref:SOS response-associated peptidase family protein n=1 Tax=Enorma burkinafasonensis TaxID=2590867 RepID=UPI0011AACA3D|nr:SOS response-associated peptidase family protein [Enorma burkinafasonensis]
MCVRMCPLTADEAQAALDARGRRGVHAIEPIERPDPAHDAHPGSSVPVYLPSENGLVVAELAWGFPLKGKAGAVFNTRLESALEQLERGHGMWSGAIATGRCVVPVRAFYESHGTERVASERTGKPVRRQYRFRVPGARAFLLAAVQEDGRFSIVTTAPNASVAPVHDRMPLVLGPGETGVWLGPDFARLADRSGIELVSEPER